MKNKYQRMNKEQKAIIKREANNNKAYQSQLFRLKRLFCTGSLGLFLGIALIVFSIYNKDPFYEYITPIILIIFSIIFILKSIQLRINIYNKVAINNKKIKI